MIRALAHMLHRGDVYALADSQTAVLRSLNSISFADLILYFAQ
jgi:hypothetical protein